MRVLLHTPLKPPDSDVASGDREMARGLTRLLERLGHSVIMPPLSRVAPGVPMFERHLALQRRAHGQAERLIARWRTLPAGHPERFDLWFTYHCYYRKPDWMGPVVSRALGIPYVISEASHAPRRAQGPIRLGHRAVEQALAEVDLVLSVNPRDMPGVKARLRPGAHQRWLPPFIDTRPFTEAAGKSRAANQVPVLLSVGMMRTRDKLASYRVLAQAFALLRNKPWKAVLVGDGPARGEIERLMGPFGERIHFTGALPHAQLPAVYAAADIYLWPAINEAYGMAFLEAQAAGLPVVAGRTGGVPAVVTDGITGMLTPIGDHVAFAQAVSHLLDHPDERARLAGGAASRIVAHHDERAAAHALAVSLALLR